MSTTERRFKEGLGERYLANGRVRCHGVSKTKLKRIRIEKKDPTLRAEDVWPEGQCSWPAEEGTFACELHGGKSPNAAKRTMDEWMPVDLREKLNILESNTDQLFNRDNEIAQLLARNAQLYEEMDELVLGVEGYLTVAEALKSLENGDIVEATILLRIALEDEKTRRESQAELRENIKLIDKLTITQFNIRKELKLMATMDQVKNMLNGIYQGFEQLMSQYIPDDLTRGKAVREFAAMLRAQSNAKHVVSLSSGD